MTTNVKLSGIPENNFLCIFIIASSPGVHTFFCLWRENKMLSQGETSHNAFQRSRSINQKWKIYMLKWAHPPLIVSIAIIRYPFSIWQCKISYYAMYLAAMSCKEITCFVLLVQIKIFFVTAFIRASQTEVKHAEYSTQFCVDPCFGQNRSISCMLF